MTDYHTIRLFGLRSPYSSRNYIYDDHAGFEQCIRDIRERAEENNVIPVLLTWNGARFDIPLLKRQYHDLSGFVFIDVMQMAQMYDHSFKKKSLDAWADKMGVGRKSHPNIDYDNAPISELSDYLANDLEITEGVFNALCDNRIGTLNDNCFSALRIEHKAAELCEEQVRRRVAFDMEKAQKLHEKIVHRMEEIEHELAKVLPVRPLPKSKIDYPPKVQFKKDGTPSAALQRFAIRNQISLVRVLSDNSWHALNKGGATIPLPIKLPLKVQERIKPSNMAEIKKWLLEEGWVPTEWNMKEGKRTTPRLTLKGNGEPDPALDGMGVTWMGMYKEWLVARSRKNVLHSDKGTGWIPLAAHYLPPCLPSDGDTMGANTSRWTHKIIANVPRVTSDYGHEMRELFKARPGLYMVGWDASALEARVEGHYCFPYDADYAKELCEGDVHTRNLTAIPSLGDRDNAKTFKYAITYGAQAPRLASYFGWDRDTAQGYFDAFWEANEALKEVRDRTIWEWKNTGERFILGLDGRPIHTRSKHSLLNARFQSAGAIIMKYAMLIAHASISERSDKFSAHGLIRYHDEEQWEVEGAYGAQLVGQLGADSIVKAGKVLKLNVPLDAEYKIGRNWAETH